MTEAAAVTVPSEVPVVETKTVSTNVSTFIGEDGSLKEGWQNSLVPEDYKEEQVFRDMAKNPNTNIKDAFKMIGGLQKVIGKKGIIPPSEGTTPETNPAEWDAYYKALGRPEKPDGYKLEYPKDMPIPENEVVRKAFLEHSFKAGKSQAQVKADYDWYNSLCKQELTLMAQAEKSEAEEAERIIKEDSGDKYDERLHIANLTIEENTQGWSQERKDKFLKAINQSSLKPYVMDMLANVGSKFMEHKGVPTNSETNTGMTPVEAKSRMDEIARTLADTTLAYNNPALRDRLTKEMEGLARLISSKK